MANDEKSIPQPNFPGPSRPPGQPVPDFIEKPPDYKDPFKVPIPFPPAIPPASPERKFSGAFHTSLLNLKSSEWRRSTAEA